MAVTWNDIVTEVQTKVEDNDFKSGGDKESYLIGIGNRVQIAVCEILDFDRHLKNSTIDTTTAEYRFDMPSDFLKPHPSMAAYVSGYDDIPATTVEYLDIVDNDHGETTTASSGPSYVAFHNSRVFIYPKWTGTLQLRNYYRVPTAMTGTNSAIDIISHGVTGDTLIQEIMVAGVLEKIYSEHLMEDTLADTYRNKLGGFISILGKRLNTGKAVSHFIRSAY